MNMMAANRRVSAGLVSALSSGMARLSVKQYVVVKLAGGLLRSLLSAQMQCRKSRESMRVSQAISTCPGCAAQAVLAVALCQEIVRLQTEVNRLQTQLSQTSANSHKPPSSDPPTRARV